MRGSSAGSGRCGPICAARCGRAFSGDSLGQTKRRGRRLTDGIAQQSRRARFEYERRILAEAEKENPNWSKFVVERQAPLPVPQQQASYIPPTFFHISVIFTWLPSDKVSSGSYLKKGLKLFMDLFWLLLLA